MRRLFPKGLDFVSRFLRGCHSSFVLSLCVLIAVQPALVEVARAQDIIIDPSGNVGSIPSLKAGPGPKVVDIAKPNTGGVSHNKYSKLDVPSQGIVLNNSTGAVQTTLAGMIDGNLNLGGVSAATILNEVTGATASGLTGTIEVAGVKAHVIIANPNGITCNGCSFLNAGSATLSTGTPVVDGSTVRLDVTKGTVTIGRGGLDGAATGLPAVNLVGRFVVIDGKVTAVSSITAQAGTQGWDAKLNKTTGALVAAPGGAVLDYGIDATAFGAMEAGRITIVGNEAGLGVRTVGALTAGAGGIAITAKDKVEVRTAAATGPVAITSTGDKVTVERDISASADKVTISGNSGVVILATAGLYGATGLTVSSGNGNVDLGGDLQADTTITGAASKGKLSFSGYGYAGGAIAFSGRNGVALDGATVVANAFSATSSNGEVSLQNSALFTAQDVQVTTVTFHLGRDVVVDGLSASDTTKLVVTASGAFRNSADMRLHSTAQITYAGALINEQSGIFEGVALVLASTQPITNSGIIFGQTSLQIDTSRFTNTATGVVMGGAVTITTTEDLLNSGLITAAGDLRLTAGTLLDTSGVAQAGRIYLTAPTIVARGASEIRGTTLIQVAAATKFTQQGTVGTPGSFTVTTPVFANTGQIIAEVALTASGATTIANDGVMVSAKAVSLTASSSIINRGTIGSYEKLTLASTGYVENRGDLFADTVLTVTGPRFSSIGTDTLVRAATGSLLTDSIINSGKILLTANFSRANLDLFQNDGVFASAGSISLTGRDSAARAVIGGTGILMAGLQADSETQVLLAGKAVALNFTNLTFSGQIAAGSNITIVGNDKQTLNGLIQTASGNITLTAANLTLGASSSLYAGGQIRINSTVGLTNQGMIVSAGRFELGTDFGYLTNSGGISVAAPYGFTMAGAFTNSGVFAASQGISIAAAKISSTGAIQAGGNIVLTSADTLTLAGSAVATSAISLSGTAITTADNTYISAIQLTISGSSFTNRGDIALSGTARNNWTLTGALTQYGLLWSPGAMRITAGSVATYNGSLLATNSALEITSEGSLTINGKVTALSAVLKGTSIGVGAGAGLTTIGNIALTGTGTVSSSGEVLSGQTLTVSGQAVTVAGKIFGTTVNLTATGSFASSGEISAIGNATLVVTEKMTNSGRIETAGQLSITGASITNAATGTFAATRLLLSSAGAIANSGLFFGAQDITIRGASLSNAAEASLTAGSLGFDLTAGFTNRGMIDVYGLFGNAAGAAVNSGTIDAETYFGLTAASFLNETYNASIGSIRSDGHVYINAIGGFTNRSGSNVTAQNIDLRIGLFTNEGSLQAGKILTATTSTGAIVNKGQIYGETIVLLAASEFSNLGTIGQRASAVLPRALVVQIATGKLSTATKVGLTNSGLIEATNISLEAKGALQNIAGGLVPNLAFGRINAAENLVLSTLAGDLVNAGWLGATQSIAISASGLLNNTGTISTTGSLWAAAGTIRNEGSAASLTASTLLLEARTGGITLGAGARVSGSDELGLRAIAGNILLEGTVSGSDITLIAQAGEISALQNIASGGTLYVSGRTVSLAGKVSATQAITLVSTAGNITTGGNITTKTLIIDAAGNLIAPGHTLRGTELTQVVANDVIRSDIIETNRKLTVVHGNTAMKDVFVSLRTGNLGTYGANDTDMSGYEAVNLNVSGSLALRSNTGGLFLAGTIIAADDLVLYAKTGLGLRNATLTAGDVLTVEAGDNIKNYGNLTFSAGDTVQLLQGNGWFNTADWLPASMDSHLVVFAKRIVVNSSHRFVNKNVTFRASEDIRQRDQVISARKIAYAAGSNILIEFDGFDWRDANPGISATSDWWDSASAGLRGHTLLAQTGGISLVAGGDIQLISGKIHSSTTLEISALGNIISEPFYIESYEDSRPGNIGWEFSAAYKAVLPGHNAANVSLSELRAYENVLTAGGNITIAAGGNISLIGTQITSTSGGISIHSAAGAITMAAAPGGWSYGYSQTTVKKSWLGLKKKVTTYTYDAYDDLYKPTSLTALNGTVSIVSTALADPASGYSTIISAGTQIAANNVFIATRAPNGSTGTAGSITLGTYAEEHSVTTSTRTKSSFLGITYKARTGTTAQTALLNIGNDLLADEILSLASGNHLTIIGGRLSGQSISISAVGNLNILAAINSTKLSKFEEKTNLVTITTIQSGFDRETAVLPQITSVAPIQFSIGGSVHIAAAPGVNLNSQLLSVIGTRQFGLKLAPIMTAEDAASSAAQAATITNDYMRDFALPGASDGAQYAYLDTLMDEFGATYHQITLRDHSWYDKQVRLTPAFQALLAIATSYLTGGAGLGLSGWQQAAANALISGTIEGAITGNLDAGLLLKSTLLAGVSSHVSGLLTAQLNLGEVMGLSDQSPFANDLRNHFAPVLVFDRLGDQIINNAVTNIFNGNPAFEGLDSLGRTFLVTEAMGVLQFGIGELGTGRGHWEGSLSHLLLHGGLGCVTMEAVNGNCASGFFAGASQSLLAGSNLTDEQKRQLAPLIGGLAGFLWADGQAVGVNFGSSIAESGLRNNYLSHQDMEDLAADLAACKASSDGCTNEERDALIEKYRSISLRRDMEYYLCYTNMCRIQHVAQMASLEDLRLAVNGDYIVLLELANRGANRLEVPSWLEDVVTENIANETRIRQACPDSSADCIINEITALHNARANADLMRSILDMTGLGGAALGAYDCTSSGGADVLACVSVLIEKKTRIKIPSGQTATYVEEVFAGTGIPADQYYDYVRRKLDLNGTPISPEEYRNFIQFSTTTRARHDASVRDIVGAMTRQDLVTQKEVTLIADGVRARTDVIVSGHPGASISVPAGYRVEDLLGNVVRDASGKPVTAITLDSRGLASLEVKTGSACLTSNQSCVYGMAVSGGDVQAVGGNWSTLGVGSSAAPGVVYVIRKE